MGKKKMTLVRQLDKLSDLPDNVIDNILRFLPLHCSIKTSVLSTNWRFNWTRKENLVLDKDFSLNACLDACVEWFDELNYMNIVNNVLLSHSGRIRVFHLYVPGIFHSTVFVNAINTWLIYVSRNGVEDLRLEYQNSNGDSNHKVPCSLFQNPELKHLSMINVVDPPSHNFKGVSYILTLELYFQDVAKDYLSNLMMKCPLLEEISLTVYCVKDPVVIIFSSKLKMLCIKYHFGFDLILNYIPNLSILSLKGFGTHAVNFPIKCQDITSFFGAVPNIEDLTVTGEILLVWAKRNLPERLPVPLQNIMSLTVCNLNVYSASQIRSLACLLNSSPKLHTLDISISEPNFREQHRPQIMEEVENLNNLKIVKVSNINGFIMYEIVLIEMILSKSSILEKLYLTSDPNVDPKVELKMVTDVMKLRRASTQAEIIYSKSKI